MPYNSDTPIGSIMPFSGYYFYPTKSYLEMSAIIHELSMDEYNIGIQNATNLANSGWLLCDGREYFMTIDPQKPMSGLCSVIYKAWGGRRTFNGDTFRVPNLQGQFLRGVEYVAKIDLESETRVNLYSRLYDINQSPLDSYGSMKNQVGSYQKDNFERHNHSIRATTRQGDHPPQDGVGDNGDLGRGTTYGLFTSEIGGNETRPKNAYVHYIIKAAHSSLNLLQLFTDNNIPE